MKTQLKVLLLIGLGALAANQASANLIVNGGFESGNTDFTSGYLYTTDQNGLFNVGPQPDSNGQGEGKYAIGGNPQYYNQYFTSTGPAHSGANMMIVNGSMVPDVTVWSQSIPVIAGRTYVFSGWFMNVIDLNNAKLNITIGGVSFPAWTIPSGGWQEFTQTFTAINTGGAILDVNVTANGNDFAMDDLAVNPVPEPTTMIAGAGALGLALLGIGRARRSSVVRIGK
jgi:hypothetical protein